VSMLSQLLSQRSVTVTGRGLTFRAVIGVRSSGLSIFWYSGDGYALEVNQSDLPNIEADGTHLWSVVFLGDLYQLDRDAGVQ